MGFRHRPEPPDDNDRQVALLAALLTSINEEIGHIMAAIDDLKVSSAASLQATQDAANRAAADAAAAATAAQAAADASAALEAQVADLTNQVALLTADAVDPAIIAAIQADVDQIATVAASIAPPTVQPV